MAYSRRLMMATKAPAVTPPAASWSWTGSALDSTGGNMNTVYDGTTWYTAVDIAGIARLQSMANGKVIQWQQGRGITAGGALNAALGKGAAMTSNGTTAWSLAGTNSGGGGIHKRSIAGGGIWQLKSSAYFGDVSGPIADGRPTGHRRIYEDTAKNAVYVCCQRDSDGNGGIARSVGGGAFSDFAPTTGHNIGRMYRAVVGSEVGYSDLIYACANSDKGDGAAAGNKPCVALYADASTGSPTFIRLDTIGTNNPGGLTDAQSMICINEGGKDALYVIVGEDDTANGGLWRCTINGNPTTAGWQGSPNLTWQKLNGGVLAANHRYRSLTGQRVGSSTYIMVGSNPTANNTPNAAGTIPVAGGSYLSVLYRALDAHTNSPTWESVTGAPNISPGGTYYPTFGTTNETWVMLTGAQATSTNKCVLGGSNWNTYDMDVDKTNQTIVVAGKSGSWISQNPWAANASNVKWQQFSNSTGGVINCHIYTHPSSNLKWTMTDVDRCGYYNLDGGAGQMHGIESAVTQTAHANYIVQDGPNAGRWLFGTQLNRNSDGTVATPCKVYYSDNWSTTTNPDAVPAFTGDTISAATEDITGVCELNYSGTTYRLAIDSGTSSLFVKVGNGAWSKVYSFGSVSKADPCTFIANSGNKDFWVMIPKSGLFYFPDVTNITNGSTTNIFPNSVAGSDTDCCGRVAQDSGNRTTLYVTWGTSLTGLWKLTGADNLVLNASGAKQSGSGTVSRITGGGGLLTNNTPCGPVSVDKTTGEIVVAIPGYSGTPDMLLYDGSTWKSIADDNYREVGMLPVWVTKDGNRIYTSQYNSGTPFAVYS